MKKISVIIPVFNEENYIQKTLEKVIAVKVDGFDKEIIIVDDGSDDNSKFKIQKSKLQVKNQKSVEIKTIFKKKNEGKGAALRTGFLKSTGDVVIVQDADLEYNPEDYSLLIEPFIQNNADVVYGSRFISHRPHRILYFWHSLGNAFLTIFSNMLTNLNLTDMETGYKAFKGSLIRQLAKKLQSKQFGFEPEITAKIAKIQELKIYEVGISYRGRTYKEGKKIGWKDGLKAIGQIIKYNLFSS